jgi:glyoxylase-like metal-dependent hydrolase (beta-lactamase superfamily II)
MSVRVYDLDTCPLYPIGVAHAHSARDASGQAWLCTRVLAVHTPEDGWVLIDTGFGRQDLANPQASMGARFVSTVRPHRATARPASEWLNTVPDGPLDISRVVLTHLDLDHAGGLRDFARVPMSVHPREWQAATQRSSLVHRLRYRQRQLQGVAQPELFGPADTTLGGFEAGRIPGLSDRFLWVSLPGHTPGHCGIAVRRDDGGYLFHVGDAVLEMQEITSATPHLSLAIRSHHALFDDSPAQGNATRKQLARLYENEGRNWTWVCGHDPNPVGPTDAHWVTRGGPKRA